MSRIDSNGGGLPVSSTLDQSEILERALDAVPRPASDPPPYLSTDGVEEPGCFGELPGTEGTTPEKPWLDRAASAGNSTIPIELICGEDGLEIPGLLGSLVGTAPGANSSGPLGTSVATASGGQSQTGAFALTNAALGAATQANANLPTFTLSENHPQTTPLPSPPSPPTTVAELLAQQANQIKSADR